MDTVKLTSGYRFTIPEKTRKKLGIKPGQKSSVMERNGTVVFVPLRDDSTGRTEHGRRVEYGRT